MSTRLYVGVLTLYLFSLMVPVFGKTIWSTQPATSENIIKTSYPVGNGQLAALPYGPPGSEKFTLNRDTLWSGGPFENASYIGGNTVPSVNSALPGIRDYIFANGQGNVSALMGTAANYGSYRVLGNFSVGIKGVENFTGYKRVLDLETGVYSTSFGVGSTGFNTTFFCSYPDSVCVYKVNSSSTLPSLTISFENLLSSKSLINATCSTTSKSALFSGITTATIGMTYKAEARLIETPKSVVCNTTTGTLTITPASNQKSISIVLAAGTNYDITKGTAADNYSFRGADPGTHIENTLSKAVSRSGNALRDAHVSDFSSNINVFKLTLPDPNNSASKETATIIAAYNTTDNTHTDPYVESLLFDYSRYLFLSSSRANSLPPNLQGKWATGLTNSWDSDYHANINLQMNHWVVDQTGLGDSQAALWNYMALTWAPRGAETAKLLYNASGWVTHNEVNIFGFTGMKDTKEEWCDYPIAAAWMMQHVADHWDYTRDVTWLRETGYPLLKGVTEYWLSSLQKDRYFKDGTLVVIPCSSAERGPTTFGCSHYQQLIHSLFIATLNTARTLSLDTSLQTSLTASLPILDKGLHISPSKQIQEWKIFFAPMENSTHRHLSHLVGWYPGTSLSGHLSGYINASISSAVKKSLVARGIGIADANAGWEKVWRSACWARLNDTSMAYSELRLAIRENFVGNGLSMYSGQSEPFQIDANFGIGGAMLSMLVVDLPGTVEGGVVSVVLGPAIPKEWGDGNLMGLRVRGGGVLSFQWDAAGVVETANWVKKGAVNVKVVNVKGKVLI